LPGHKANPAHVEDEVENHQGNERQRENEMEVAPVVAMEAPQVLLRLSAAGPRNEEPEKYPDEHHDQDHDKQQGVNDGVPMGFFHGSLLRGILIQREPVSRCSRIARQRCRLSRTTTQKNRCVWPQIADHSPSIPNPSLSGRPFALGRVPVLLAQSHEGVREVPSRTQPCRGRLNHSVARMR
jgi:hypothetical protein